MIGMRAGSAEHRDHAAVVAPYPKQDTRMGEAECARVMGAAMRAYDAARTAYILAGNEKDEAGQAKALADMEEQKRIYSDAKWKMQRAQRMVAGAVNS